MVFRDYVALKATKKMDGNGDLLPRAVLKGFGVQPCPHEAALFLYKTTSDSILLDASPGDCLCSYLSIDLLRKLTHNDLLISPPKKVTFSSIQISALFHPDMVEGYTQKRPMGLPPSCQMIVFCSDHMSRTIFPKEF